jgi:hypothetical protein
MMAAHRLQGNLPGIRLSHYSRLAKLIPTLFALEEPIKNIT